MFDSGTITFTDEPYHVVPPLGGRDDVSGCSFVLWHTLEDPVTIGGPTRRTFPVPPSVMFPVNDLDPGEFPYLDGPVGEEIHILLAGRTGRRLMGFGLATQVGQITKRAWQELQQELAAMRSQQDSLVVDQTTLAAQQESTAEQISTTASMVSNLQSTASTATGAISRGDQVHAQLQQQIDAIALRTSTVEAQAANIASMQQAITALQTAMSSKNKIYVASGSVSVPTIALLASTTRTITLSPAMPDTNYHVTWWLDAPIVGKVGVTYVKTSPSVITFTLNALLAVGSGSNLYALAIATG